MCRTRSVSGSKSAARRGGTALAAVAVLSALALLVQPMASQLPAAAAAGDAPVITFVVDNAGRAEGGDTVVI